MGYAWIQEVLDNPNCPTYLHVIDSGMTPSVISAMPDDVPRVVMVLHPRHPPIYMGIDSNGDLCLASMCPNDQIDISIMVSG